jgi:hypothetical protein
LPAPDLGEQAGEPKAAVVHQRAAWDTGLFGCLAFSLPMKN